MLTLKVIAASAIAAAAVTCGAAHLQASDHFDGEPNSTSAMVNRAAKSDLAKSDLAWTASAGPAARTISIEPLGLPQTSVVLRLPGEPKRGEGLSSDDAAASSRRLEACEPPVSALTDIAKALMPGRCVT